MDSIRPLSNPLISARPAAARPAAAEEEQESTPQESFQPSPVRRGRATEDLEQPVDLVHPLTAAEFRPPLDEALSRLPLRLLRSIARQGYRVHVVDSTGVLPLTLELEEGGDELLECSWERQRSLREVATQRGAVEREEVDALVARILELNPELMAVPDRPEETPIWPGQTLTLPDYYCWRGQPVSAAAWEFVTRPRRSNVAGMVLNGATPGLVGEGLHIVLWDNLFRLNDGLMDWYVLHELGHTTDFSYAFLRPDSWRNWRKRLEAAFEATSRHITRYSGEALVEYFAEGFAAWATPAPRPPGPGLAPLALERCALHKALVPPELTALIEEAVAACD